jgi:hypothetical protein
MRHGRPRISLTLNASSADAFSIHGVQSAEKNEANFLWSLTFRRNFLILFLNFREEKHA